MAEAVKWFRTDRHLAALVALVVAPFGGEPSNLLRSDPVFLLRILAAVVDCVQVESAALHTVPVKARRRASSATRGITVPLIAL
jgi:hypothetical protein